MPEPEYGVIPQDAREGAKQALVLSADKFEDMELYVPVFCLIAAGWRVDIAAPKKGKITGESGWYYIAANKTIDEINPDEYDLLLIPGGRPGGAPTVVQNSKKAQAIAKSFFARNKPVAAICHGPWLLVSAGLVKGRRLASFWGDGVPEDIKKAGGIWEDKDVVVDGNLVTSRWPMDIAAFIREMMKLVGK
ncbi:MAG: type 1 glutamine amidotransferase [Candidatus Sungbacteria bacterium]|uniref:Type 1 glutamine amidotransferase n=1 Tax=Candidatus Sungiibacteriota bacterium TaxID=2750080 RepID=A0A9D6QU53_9BACT|nr:type 1 glutamine amidotransferase [Candidatus Sungbacteria bacterium]